jgi:hypothetical protein
MSEKVRIEAFVEGFYFPKYTGLIFHSGMFWINCMPAKRVYNNGSISINYYGSKISLKTLRKQAIRINIKLIDDVPF